MNTTDYTGCQILLQAGWAPKGVSHTLWSHPFIELCDVACGVSTEKALIVTADLWLSHRTQFINNWITTRATEVAMTSLAERIKSGGTLPLTGTTSNDMIAQTMRPLFKWLLSQYIAKITHINRQFIHHEHYNPSKWTPSNVHHNVGDITVGHNNRGIIINGVNCQKQMGSGVARALYTRYPRVRSQYMELTRHAMPGDVDIVHVDMDVYVANCYTQEFLQGHPLAPSDGRVASADAIRTCMLNVAHQAETILFADDGMVLPIHLPLVGSDLGGLSWSIDVEPIIHEIAEKYPLLEFHIWVLPNK